MKRPMVNVYEPDADGVEQLVYRPMNDDEHADWQECREQALEAARADKQAEIAAALAASDVWVLRHVEDGVSLTDERKAYRDELRQLHEYAGTSDTPDSLDLPDPPEVS